MIIHEESLFGTGTATLLARELPGYDFDVKEVIKHANPPRTKRLRAAPPHFGQTKPRGQRAACSATWHCASLA
jgi:hypothetical protein